MPTTILISTATAIAISNAQKLKTLILYTKRNVFIERLTSQLLRFRVHNNCKWEKGAVHIARETHPQSQQQRHN